MKTAKIVALFGLLVLGFSSALGTEKTLKNSILLEVFYLPHAPAIRIVEKVEEQVKAYPHIQLKKYQFGDHTISKKVKQYRINGHIPVAIFINGKDQFTVNNRRVVFRNFPQGDSFVPMFEGKWTYQDLDTVLKRQAR